MADYYSHRDPRQKGDQYLDYETGSGLGWIWAIVVLVAFVALIALGVSGGGDGTTADGATAAGADATAPVAADSSTIEAPAATTAPASE